MAKITTNVGNLSVLEKIAKGQAIIAMSTNNPNVTGNTTALAAFSTEQAALLAADADFETARLSCKEKMADRDAALAAWLDGLNTLAAVTEVGTDGDAASILSTGFDVKAARTPTQPLDAPANVRAATNGTPGHTTVSCDPLASAKSYLVQKCGDPITPGGWETVATPTKASCDTNGVLPGSLVWYRMAGVNARGQSPWSEPAARPVM